MNKFVPGQPLADDTVWLIEQMPGPYSATQDLSPILRQQCWWGSYNLAAIPSVQVHCDLRLRIGVANVCSC